MLIFSMPTLDIDMVVATACNNLAVMSTMDESGGIFAPLQQSIKKDPTRWASFKIVQFSFFCFVGFYVLRCWDLIIFLFSKEQWWWCREREVL